MPNTTERTMGLHNSERIFGSERPLSPEELRWSRVHIESDKRKPLPEWWGKRR